MHYKIYIFIFLIFTLLVSCSTNVNKSYNKDMSIAEKKEILVQKKILINEMAKASIKISSPFMGDILERKISFFEKLFFFNLRPLYTIGIPSGIYICRLNL